MVASTQRRVISGLQVIPLSGDFEHWSKPEFQTEQQEGKAGFSRCDLKTQETPQANSQRG